MTVPKQIQPTPTLARMIPLGVDSFALQVTISESTRDKVRHAQALLGHRVSARDIAQVIDLALDALVEQLEKRKFARTDRPRPSRCRAMAGEHLVPAHVKSAVWERDGGRCTFMSDSGRRCEARASLEFDHVDPVARGGTATVERVRLLCRAHNQLEAERAFGAEFMSQKRAARREADEKRVRSAEAERAKARVRTQEQELGPCLRQLGYRPDEIRRAAEHCATSPEISLEDRVRMALAYLCPRTVRRAPEPQGMAASLGG